MSERPLFIDPIAVGGGDDVDDAPAPRWFLAVALALLVAAGYYAGSFWSGPRDDAGHRFQPGREVYENVANPAATPAAEGH